MDEDWDDDEWEDEPEYGSEEDDWIECPNCHSEIYYDAEQCPKCGEYITKGFASVSQKPFWVLAIAVILIILFLIQGFSF